MLDLVGTSSLSDCRRALTPRGTYVLVGVKDMGRWFGLGRQFKALLLSPFVRQRMRVFVVRHNRDDLAVLKELVEAGKVTPVIDRRYTLSEVPEALRYQGEGHAQGKIVIVVSGAKRPPMSGLGGLLRRASIHLSAARRTSRSTVLVARSPVAVQRTISAHQRRGVRPALVLARTFRPPGLRLCFARKARFGLSGACPRSAGW